jgi:hypothetical protein
VWERVCSDRDSIKYQCDNLDDVTRSVTPSMTNDSCGCSKQSHYGLRLVISLNIFDCYGRGDFGTDFLVATACRFLPVRRRVLAVPLSLHIGCRWRWRRSKTEQ